MHLKTCALPTEVNMINVALSENALSRKMIRKWFARFRVDDDEHSEWDWNKMIDYTLLNCHI